MSPRKLLLADDSITIQKVVNLTFADEGIEVVTVGDGDAAMERVFDFKPDLIMADVNMPGLNGYQICEKIKQSDEFGKTPVILLVGSFEPFDESEAQRVGADDFLTKPFQSIRQLVSKVTELLDSDKDVLASSEDEDGENQNVISHETAGDFAAPRNNFSDDGIDDEMVQALPGGFALDETAKFETKELSETPEYSAETQPLSSEQIERIYSSATKAGAEEQKENSDFYTENYLSEQISAEPSYQENFQESNTTETSQKSRFADLEFDDDFLLELPPDEDEESEDTSEEASPTFAEKTRQIETSPDAGEISETETEDEEAKELTEPEEVSADYEESYPAAAKTPEEKETVTVVEANEIPDRDQPNHASFAASSQLSSETIDIIVRKVVERLSDKAVREIVQEVVPQVTDEIVKRMTEEKMKES